MLRWRSVVVGRCCFCRRRFVVDAQHIPVKSDGDHGRLRLGRMITSWKSL